MMKKITLLFALLITSIGFSQTYDLLESFNSTGYEDAFGDASAEYAADPTDATTQVVKITSTDGSGQIWQGINVVLTSNYTLTSDTQLSMQLDVYSNTAITIAPKAQGGVSGAPDSVTSADHAGEGWETLTFTFDKSLDGKVPANGNYSDFALHVNWNTAADTFGTPDGRVFYIKNLKGLSVAPPEVDSQTYDLLESFNSTGYEGAFGDASAEYAADPADATTQVVKITSTDGSGQIWQGINVVLTSNYTLTSDTQLSMQLDVYSNTAITIAPKAQGGVSGAPDSVTSADHGGEGWETLTFTFDKSLDGKVPANGNYSDFALHVNWNTAADTFGTPDGRVFYIKNLKGLSVAPPVDNTIPEEASPIPNSYGTHLALLDGLTDTGTFTNFWNPSYNFGETPQFIDLDASDDGVNKAARINLKIGWGGGINDGTDVVTDVSANDMVHIDYYIPSSVDPGVNGHQFYLDIISRTGGVNKEVFYGFGSTVAVTGDSGTVDEVIVFDAWQSIDIPLATFVDKGLDASTFFQFKIAAQSDIRTQLGYFDNIYFYKASTLSLNKNEVIDFSMYPNPAANSLNISAKEAIQNATIYNVLGKQVMSLKINKNSESIDVSNLSTGMYLIKYTIGNAVGTAKFIKQ
jgi:hypothetical protein